MRMEVIETLVDVDQNGVLIPGLATAWQSNKNHTQWRFSLRKGVTFHNGERLNAAAVVKSLTYAFAKPAPFESDLVKAIEQSGDNEVVVTLNRPYRPFAAILSNYTTAILAPASFDNVGNVTSLLGTGPYVVRQFQPPHALDVEAFEQYWGTPASIKEVKYITGHRSESRALMVKSGQADIVYNLDAASVDLLAQAENVTVDSTFIPRTILIKLNAAHPALQDARVRHALSLGLDRQGIAEFILRVPNVEANQMFGPSMGVWHLPELPAAQTDLTQAQALLDEAGWRVGENGIRQKDGKTLALSMITYANRPELIVIATAIQDQWRKLGVSLSVEMENSSAIPIGHVEGTLETALMARNLANIPDPLALLLSDFTTEQGGDWGPMNWSNPQVFDALHVLEKEQDTARYNELAKTVARDIATDLPMIPVTFYVQQTAIAKRIQGFSFDPYERSFNISHMSVQVEP